MLIASAIKLNEEASMTLMGTCWKSLIQPLLSFFAVSVGLAWIVSLFMSNGVQNVTSSGTTISLGDPTMTVFVMCVLNIAIIILYFRITKGCFKDLIKYTKAVASNITGAVSGAMGVLAREFTAGKRNRRLVRTLEGSYGGTASTSPASRGNSNVSGSSSHGSNKYAKDSGDSSDSGSGSGAGGLFTALGLGAGLGAAAASQSGDSSGGGSGDSGSTGNKFDDMLNNARKKASDFADNTKKEAADIREQGREKALGKAITFDERAKRQTAKADKFNTKFEASGSKLAGLGATAYGKMAARNTKKSEKLLNKGEKMDSGSTLTALGKRGVAKGAFNVAKAGAKGGAKVAVKGAKTGVNLAKSATKTAVSGASQVSKNVRRYGVIGGAGLSVAQGVGHTTKAVAKASKKGAKMAVSGVKTTKNAINTVRTSEAYGQVKAGAKEVYSKVKSEAKETYNVGRSVAKDMYAVGRQKVTNDLNAGREKVSSAYKNFGRKKGGNNYDAATT